MNGVDKILNRKFYFCWVKWLSKRRKYAFFQRALLLFVLSIFVNIVAFAQQEPLFSSYMLGKTATNPGFIGGEDAINALFTNRIMFAGFGDGKPETSMFGVEAPVEMFGIRSGLGILIMSDKVGFMNNVNVELSYSYRRNFEVGKLGVGVTVGFNSFGIEPEWHVAEGLEDYSISISDPTFTTQLSKISVGIGAGVIYETPQYYVGLSVSKLKGSEIYTETENSTRFYYDVPHFYLTGGYNIKLPNPLMELQPTFLLRTDLASYSMDLNGTFYISDKYLAGAGLRVTPKNLSALTFMGGLELLNGFNLIYSLDVNFGQMMIYGLTSHEVTVTYSFNLDMKKNQKYKSIRYL